MDKIYKTIYDFGQDEVIINKSTFIAYAKPVNTEEEALAFIDMIKIKHKDATHNVHAYVLGKDSNIQRFNDDGEPSGTAGIPMLEVLKKEDLRNIVVVVTRYFGGIKLGGGGLIRAYTKAAKIGIDAGIIVDMVLHTKIKFKVDYTLYGKIENFLMTEGYSIEESIFDETVNIILFIEENLKEQFYKKILDLTNGTASFEELGEEHIPTQDGKRI